MSLVPGAADGAVTADVPSAGDPDRPRRRWPWISLAVILAGGDVVEAAADWQVRRSREAISSAYDRSLQRVEIAEAQVAALREYAGPRLVVAPPSVSVGLEQQLRDEAAKGPESVDAAVADIRGALVLP